MKTIIYFILFLVISNSVQSQWIQRYNGTGNTDDIAYSTAVDTSGNVYVTGKSKGIGTGFDYATIKYNSLGIQQWVARYNGLWNNSDIPTSIAVDGSGNVYVTGGSADTLTSIDYATVKYNSSGVQQWVIRYNGPGNGIDWANAISVDGSGNVYVTGSSTGTTTKRDFATIKYNSSGVLQWIQRFNGPVNSDDVANSISLDGSGNVYVAGGGLESNASTDYAVIKYNNSGVQQWIRRYNGQRSSADIISAMTVDGIGNVYVTGRSRVATIDYLTIKYNTNGDLLWSNVYNGTGNYEDMASSVKVDVSGNVYVTGQSYGSVSNFDYVTLKLNSSGVQQWVQRYNGTGNGSDCATSLAIDATGNAYVTGKSWGGSNDDYVTLKYNSSGIQQWVQNYNGTGNGDDRAAAVLLDKTGNVYVTGRSKGTGIYFDYATVKYLNGNAIILQPSISVSPVQINQGSSVNITGANFRPNVPIKVNVFSSNSQLVLDQSYISNGTGGFSINYASSASSSTGIYTVSAYDIATSQNAPNKIFEVIQPPETFELKLTSPNSDSVGRVINVEWIDKMLKGSVYPDSNITRHYKYKVNYILNDDSVNWSSDLILEGNEYINSTSVFNKQIVLPPLNTIRSGTNFKVKVTDYYNTSRKSESAAIPIKTTALVRANLNLLWDYYSEQQAGIAPKGVCADGVSRLYINVLKTSESESILSVKVKLSENTESNSMRILGKIKVATVRNNQYSDEANNAGEKEATIFGQNDNWFWYVSPDDFERDGGIDLLKSERTVTATVTVNYSDGTSESGSHNISIVRTPLMLVHGFGANQSVWDVFKARIYFNNKFKFITTPNMETDKSYVYNASILLNGNQSINTFENSFENVIKNVRLKGYACNQVSYVSHSMGGGIARTAIALPGYIDNRNYSKGYVNRLITIDTPHNGSPLANFFVKLKPELNSVSGSSLKIALLLNLRTIIATTNNLLIRSAYKVNSLNFVECTEGLKNLQSNVDGKRFSETNIPSFLIAGDLFESSSSNFGNVSWETLDAGEFKNILNLLDKFLKLVTVTELKENFLLPCDYFNAFSLLLKRNKAERVFKLLNLVYKKLIGSDTFLPNSDYVVSVNSQLANISDPERTHTFDKFNGVPNSLGIGHAFKNECTKDINIFNTVVNYLNLPTNNNGFTQTIQASQSEIFPEISCMDQIGNMSMIDTANHISIISPENGKSCTVDSTLNVNFAIDDTSNLKYVNVSFQGQDYYDTVKSFNYNFIIAINGNELDSTSLLISALYTNGDSINYSSDFRRLFVKTNSAVTDFKVSNDFYFMMNNETIIPDYNSVYTNFINTNRLNSITATINNPSIIGFDNIEKSFKAISNGETFAIVNNGGKSDTIYFSVNGEILSPGNTNLIYPVDQAFVPSSDLKLSWNIVDYASQYNLQIADDINFENIVYRSNNISDTITTVTDIQDSVTYYWRVKAINSAGSGNWSSVRTFITYPLFNAHFYITVIPQGLYSESTNSLRKKDTVKAYLMSVNSPYNIIDSASSVIDSISHQGLFNFVNATNGTYYLKVKHRNSIGTWSKSGGEVFTKYSTMNFDFTSSQSQAFGSNLIRIGSAWCIYSGDVNQDEVIDASDISEVDNDAYNSVSGYVRTDVTGDDFVDAADMSIVDNNAFNSVSVIRP